MARTNVTLSVTMQEAVGVAHVAIDKPTPPPLQGVVNPKVEVLLNPGLVQAPHIARLVQMPPIEPLIRPLVFHNLKPY